MNNYQLALKILSSSALDSLSSKQLNTLNSQELNTLHKNPSELLLTGTLKVCHDNLL